eukprot:2605796-Prymnesium_polylepis.1
MSHLLCVPVCLHLLTSTCGCGSLSRVPSLPLPLFSLSLCAPAPHRWIASTAAAAAPGNSITTAVGGARKCLRPGAVDC